MKEICQCNCSSPATAYRTPWCSMLRGGEPTEILHLWYKLEWLRKEVEKRSSYLGKFRRTEEAQHLLDLIAMTVDEVDLFIPYAKAAMADVFDVLHTFMPRREKALFWREGRETVYIPEQLVTPVLVDKKEEDDYLYLSSIATEDVDADGYIVVDVLPVDDDEYIKVAETGTTLDGDYITIRYKEGYYLQLSRIATEDVDDDGYITADVIQDDADGYIMISETGSTPDDYIAIQYHAGQYVEYNGGLYMAISDGDSYEVAEKLVPTEDYRDSIHYGLNWKCCGSNINAVEPLDTAIFEALVARIIYKWLNYSYPDEAPRYLNEWNVCLEQIRHRCDILNGPQIVNRIPRIF